MKYDNTYKIYKVVQGLLDRVDEGTFEMDYSLTITSGKDKESKYNVSGTGGTEPVKRSALELGYTGIDFSAGADYVYTMINSKTKLPYSGRMFNKNLGLDSLAFDIDAYDFSQGSVGVLVKEASGKFEPLKDGSKGTYEGDITFSPNFYLKDSGDNESTIVAHKVTLRYNPPEGGEVSTHCYVRLAGLKWTRRDSNFIWKLEAGTTTDVLNVYAEVNNKGELILTGIIPEDGSSYSYNTYYLYLRGNYKKKAERVWESGDVDTLSELTEYTYVDEIEVNGVAATKSGGSFYIPIPKTKLRTTLPIVLKVTDYHSGIVGDTNTIISKDFLITLEGYEWGIRSATVTSSTLIPASGGKISSVTFTYYCNGVKYESKTYKLSSEVKADSRGTSYTLDDIDKKAKDIKTVTVTITLEDLYGKFTKDIKVTITQAPNTRTLKNRSDYSVSVSESGSITASGGAISYKYNAYHHEYWYYASTSSSDDEVVYDPCSVSFTDSDNPRLSISGDTSKDAGSSDAIVTVTHSDMGTLVGVNGSATDKFTISFYNRTYSSTVAKDTKEAEATNSRSEVYLTPTFTLGDVSDIIPNGTSTSTAPKISDVAQKYKYAFTSGAEEPNNQTYDVGANQLVYDIYYSNDNVNWYKSTESGYSLTFTSSNEGTTQSSRKLLGTIYAKIKMLNEPVASENSAYSVVKSVKVYQKANTYTDAADATTGYTGTVSKESGSKISYEGETIYVYIYRQHGHYRTWTSGSKPWIAATDEKITSSGKVKYSLGGNDYADVSYNSAAEGYTYSVPTNTSTSSRNVSLYWYIDGTYNNSTKPWSYTQNGKPLPTLTATASVSGSTLTVKVTNTYSSDKNLYYMYIFSSYPIKDYLKYKSSNTYVVKANDSLTITLNNNSYKGCYLTFADTEYVEKITSIVIS